MPTPEPLRLQVSAPERALLGRPLILGIVLVNRGGDTVDVTLVGDPHFDLTVTRPDGAVVWSRLPTNGFVPDVAATRRMRPGDSLLLRDTWPQIDARGDKIPPGRYCVYGIVFGTPSNLRLRAMLAEPAVIVIEP